MTLPRTTFLLCVASLFSQQKMGAHSFVVVSPSSSSKTVVGGGTRSSSRLRYANSDVTTANDETTTTSGISSPSQKLNSFLNSIMESYHTEDKEDVNVGASVSTAELLTKQLAREFTAARRYMLAAGSIKCMSEYFYAEEEQQRVRAMELIEYARTQSIQLSSDDYADRIVKSPIDKSLPLVEFVQELWKQEQEDIQFLNKALAQASSSLDPELINFLESIRSNQMDRQQEFVQLLTQSMPSIDVNSLVGALDTAGAATAAVSSPDAAITAHQSLSASTDNLVGTATSRGLTNLNNLPKSPAEDLGQVDHTQMEIVVAATTGATIGVAAVDSDSLPTTEDILDALPIDTDEIVEMVDSLTDSFPTTEDILDALPAIVSASPDEILQAAVDNSEVLGSFVSFVEEQSELIDTVQQNLMDAETLTQIVDIVAQLY